MRHFVRNKPRFSYLLCFVKSLVWITKDMVVILLQIAGLVVVNKVRLRLHRFFGIEIRGQDFVVDVDQFECRLGDGFGSRNHTGYIVAHIANLVGRQRMLVVADGQDTVRIGRVLAGHDGHHAV